MKILFYLTRFPGIGGIENVTNIIVSKLKKNNDISIISHINNNAANPLEGVKLFFMPNNKNWCAKENIQYVQNIIEENNFDAIIYQDSYAPTDKLVCSLSKKYNIPLYVFEHNTPLFVYNKRNLDSIFTLKGFLRKLLHPYLVHKEIKRKRNLLEHSKKYVLLSKQFIPEFCNLVNANTDDERITFINNPILPKGNNNCTKKENIILCVSRLAREKCVDKMIYMWNEISKELQDWRFVIIGDGPEKSKLESIVNKCKIQRVDFIGFANPDSYYKKAKIFWMTSKYEGWGMTLIEAMQFGCVPIVFKTFSSVSDIIISGNNGFLISPENKEDFIKQTLKLSKDEVLRKNMGKCAIKVTDKFSINKIIEQWEELLNQK